MFGVRERNGNVLLELPFTYGKRLKFGMELADASQGRVSLVNQEPHVAVECDQHLAVICDGRSIGEILIAVVRRADYCEQKRPIPWIGGYCPRLADYEQTVTVLLPGLIADLEAELEEQ